MKEVYRKPYAVCPHKSKMQVCRKRENHPRGGSIVHYTNAEIRTFNGCGFCKVRVVGLVLVLVRMLTTDVQQRLFSGRILIPSLIQVRPRSLVPCLLRQIMAGPVVVRSTFRFCGPCIYYRYIS